MKQRRVVIGGLPFFGKMLIELLQAPGWEFRYLEPPGSRPAAWIRAVAALGRADLVYLIGGQLKRGSRPDRLARFVRCPIVMHWVGSDINYALAAAARGWASERLIRRPVHWAEVPWTSAELLPLGIEAEVVPLTSMRLPATVTPLPECFTVLAYLPDSRPEFYGRDAVMSLACALPQAQILVAGGSERPEDAPQNVEYLGWVDDMSPVYERTTVLLRLPEHDGLSFMVLEALAAGRYAIWNQELPGVLHAGSRLEARDQLEHLLALHRERSLRPNDAGRAKVAAQFSREKIRTEILQRFGYLLDDRGGAK